MGGCVGWLLHVEEDDVDGRKKVEGRKETKEEVKWAERGGRENACLLSFLGSD